MLLPGLAAEFPGLAADALQPAPGLSKLLSRSSQQPFAPRLSDPAALALFDVEPSEADLPVAPFRYLGQFGREADGYCLNADPVHLRADPRGLLLFDASMLAISEQERAALSASLRDFFDACGWRLETASTQHWYLSGEAPGELHTTPLAKVSGRTVDSCLPRGSAAAVWLQRSNELQMLLHAHPVNEQRAARGQPAINSLWLWGGGVLPPRHAARFDRVYTDNPFIKGLGAWHQAQCEPLPGQSASVYDASSRSEVVLLTLEQCQRAASHGDTENWNAAVADYERTWFMPAVQALARRRIKQLDLLPLDGRRYRITARDLWRLWRPRRLYRDVLQTAGES